MADQRSAVDGALGPSLHIVPDFDAQSMARIVVLVVERDREVLDNVTQTLKRAGVRLIHAHASLYEATAELAKIAPDLIIVGDDVAPEAFDFVRDIRHNRIGTNPFVLIATLMAQDHLGAVDAAMQAGTDDIIVKPIKEDQLLQRLKRATINRQAFVVSSDFLGPDRRSKPRPSHLKRLNVLNTMLEKAAGKDIAPTDVKNAVDRSMGQVLQARLKSHGRRLGFICALVARAYRDNAIDASVRENLNVLVDVLRDAAKTAERIGERELVILCGSLSRDAAAIAERYIKPTPNDLAFLQKLPRAILSAIDPGAEVDAIDKQAQEVPTTHPLRRRQSFAKVTEIHLEPNEAPVATVEEPVVEILPLDAGQVLFSQGEPATAAYIVVSGQIGIYRNVGGASVPVTKIRKGELFGEMAAIDGTPRRATAVALEPSTISIVAKDTIESKMRTSDSDTQAIVRMLIDALRKVPEKYAARPRHVSDVLTELNEQVERVRNFVDAPATAVAVRDAAALALADLIRISREIAELIGTNSGADRRAAALPPAAVGADA